MIQPREKGHPVLSRFTSEQMKQLRDVAEQRDLPIATVVRQLVRERLGELAREAVGRDAREH